MHRLAREERLRGKKLRGKRKRKEREREKAPGQDFTVDVADERFAAVLEGDTRFGIDRTDSSFKVRQGPRGWVLVLRGGGTVVGMRLRRGVRGCCTLVR